MRSHCSLTKLVSRESKSNMRSSRYADSVRLLSSRDTANSFLLSRRTAYTSSKLSLSSKLLANLSNLNELSSNTLFLVSFGPLARLLPSLPSTSLKSIRRSQKMLTRSMNKAEQRKKVSLRRQILANETLPTRVKGLQTTATKTNDYPILLFRPIVVRPLVQSTINKNLLLQLERSVLQLPDLSLPLPPSSSVVIPPLLSRPLHQQCHLIEQIDQSFEPTPQLEISTCQNENGPTRLPTSPSPSLPPLPRLLQLLPDLVLVAQQSHSPLEPRRNMFHSFTQGLPVILTSRLSWQSTRRVVRKLQRGFGELRNPGEQHLRS